MQLAPQQETAFKKVKRWKTLKNQPFFVLGGYAGTGKTTIAKALIEGDPHALVAAYTGKAAHVLRQQGLEASTIHKLIYLPRDKCDSRLRHLLEEKKRLLSLTPPDHVKAKKIEHAIYKERANLKRPDFNLNNDSPLWEASLLVIDEYSMVDEQMGEDLLSFGCPILALGDPGQLPPVQGKRYFQGEPDFMLTDIHRQAADNPIIHMSKIVREGGRLSIGNYGDSRVVRLGKLTDAEYNREVMACDQVLVGLNNTRHGFNREFRAQLKRQECWPEKGDKLVCLRNNHKEGLLNGQIWYVEETSMSKGHIYLYMKNQDDGTYLGCLAHSNPFHNPPLEIDMSTRKKANEFDYGYAMTVHKAQGSQWKHVVLYDEWRLRDRIKWLYTGITRASEKLTIVVP